jgi:hypothetical protein
VLGEDKQNQSDRPLETLIHAFTKREAITDNRSVLEVFDNINQQGRIVATAIDNLRGFIEQSNQKNTYELK